MLLLVATPIGNLSDITFRAIEALKNCDYILCEDTRHSQKLLNHYQIKKSLKSFHLFSEASKEETILDDLRNGKQIALISDAGTPTISDPGNRLVKRCREENLAVTPIPGACAAIAAVCCSGLDTTRFQFFGFLPRKAGELKKSLIEILEYPGTTVCYESPNRLITVLKALEHLAPERKIVVTRELTKQFEEVKQGFAAELIGHWSDHAVKGEIVLLIEGKTNDGDTNEWLQLSPEEHIKVLEDTYHLSRNEAIKLAAKSRGVPKRTLYSKLIKK